MKNRMTLWSDLVYTSLSIYQLSTFDSITIMANVKSIIDVFSVLNLWNIARSSIFFNSKLNLSNQGINSEHLIKLDILEFH
jgi:hypothetical protein